jgi:anhydro-N-acetylmuramic acid kinase
MSTLASCVRKAREARKAGEAGGPEGIHVAGVLSGTSADGVDVGIVRFRAPGGRLEPPDLLAFGTSPYPSELERRLRALLDASPGPGIDLGGLARLDRDLGLCFGRAARALADEAGLALDLIGSHGQTVWHHDGVDPTGPATLQLGNLNAVAEAALVPVAGDFRQADVAAGGEGAPLSALVDPFLFPTAPRPAAILNLGGIGNLTWLGAGGELMAFDTGPAGSLLDGVARAVADVPLDRGGKLALRGRVNEQTVEGLLDHPFYRTPPPRSTGRDTFGASFVEAFLSRAREPSREAGEASAADLMATATALVARTVALAVTDHLPALPRQVIVAGGGIHNRALMGELEARLGVPLVSSAEYGVNPDAREAEVFAFLAGACLLGVPLTQPGVTGAAEGHVLGHLVQGPTPGLTGVGS